AAEGMAGRPHGSAALSRRPLAPGSIRSPRLPGASGHHARRDRWWSYPCAQSPEGAGRLPGCMRGPAEGERIVTSQLQGVASGIAWKLQRELRAAELLVDH